MRRGALAALAAGLTAAALTSCGTGGGSDVLTVYAAASLRAPFTEIAERFEEANPGVTVELSFAGSSDLETQLEQGAPADVFASADTRTMDAAVDAGVVAGEPIPFATNTLTIATEPGNPKNVTSFEDLTGGGLSVVVCAPQVPCGAATERLEKTAGVELAPVSEESSVTDVLGKVTSGQADAGLVYVTDATGAGEKVTVVSVPEAAEVVNIYPVAALSDSRDLQRADAFVRFVTGTDGRAVLADAGFGAP
ncbi:molybdate transport system substrate-binding protein [Rhodococcus rhodochrous J45]|uniref:Molybdate transport system substrate-binding protein n=1 Tax=Rhodococcus rhodochrous J45 TaxID=935266 RepID=A0A562ES05_RHORH|nr:molybdate ABC transporter substrate-binding protein [Rhodococcus rhodochrous]TWH24712.1 molybdate transport system substrate-binding protein [Rhodococcus rhodochrous J45]